MEPKNPTVEDTIIKDEETYCPACGHFAGVYEYCPRCGTYIPKRATIKFFKWFSAILSVVGLIFLYFWVIYRDAVEIKTNQITETMNLAYVLMKGTVTRDGKIFYDDYKKPNYLTFSLSDGTGEVRVVAYKNNVERIISSNLLPRKGDSVAVQGQLRVKADQNYSLTIQSAEQLTIRRAQEAENLPVMSPGKITKKDVGKEIKVEANVIKLIPPRKDSRAPGMVHLIDNRGDKAQMTVWSNDYQELIQRGLQIGDKICARVTINEHRGALQLKLKMADDLTRFDKQGKAIKNIAASLPDMSNDAPKKNKPEDSKPEPGNGYGSESNDRDEGNGGSKGNGGSSDKLQNQPEPKKPKVAPIVLTPLEKIGKPEVGKEIYVQGKIVSVRQPKPGSKAPVTIEISDEKGKGTLVLWPDTYADVAKAITIKPGEKIKARVIVNEYKGKMQLMVKQSEHLMPFVESAPVPEPQPSSKSMDIKKITNQNEGQSTQIEGIITEIRKLSPGHRLMVQDSTGRIAIMLWNRIFEDAPILQKLKEGCKVRISGTVALFKEKVQIQPQDVDDLVLLTDGSPEIVYSKLGDATRQHVGKLVRAQGKVISKRQVKPGTALVIADDSGKMGIMLWERTFKDSKILIQIPAQGFIEVTGILSEHREKLQIQPRNESDIKILKGKSAPKENPEEKNSNDESSEAGWQEKKPVQTPEKQTPEKQTPEKQIPEKEKPAQPDNPEKLPDKTPAEEKTSRAESSADDFVTGETQTMERSHVFSDFISYIKQDHVGKLVQFKGWVLDRKNVADGIKLLFKDRSARISVVLFEKDFKNSQIYNDIALGYEVRIRAYVAKYQGELVITPRGPKDIDLISTKSDIASRSPGEEGDEKTDAADSGEKFQPSSEKAISKILRDEFLGKTVAFQGKISRAEEIKIGKRLVLIDNSGRIEVILPKNVFFKDPIWEKAEQGNWIDITATLEKFQGRFEVKPQKPEDIKIMENKGVANVNTNANGSSGKKETAEVTDIEQIKKPENLKKWITITAMVASQGVIPPGIKFTMEDSAGRIDLIVPNRLLEGDAAEFFMQCKPGSKVKFSAKVTQYRQQFQLALHNRQDFVVLEASNAIPVPTVPVVDETYMARFEKEGYCPLYEKSDFAQYLGAPVVVEGVLQQGKQTLQTGSKTIRLQFPQQYPLDSLKEGEKIKLRGTLLQKGDWILSIQSMN